MEQDENNFQQNNCSQNLQNFLNGVKPILSVEAMVEIINTNLAKIDTIS